MTLFAVNYMLYESIRYLLWPSDLLQASSDDLPDILDPEWPQVLLEKPPMFDDTNWRAAT